jgi:low-affinity ferrous iron transport protein
MFKRILDILRQPGVKGAVQGVAPTHCVSKNRDQADIRDDEENKVAGFLEIEKPRVLDRWLDRIVRSSGSEPVFFSILAGLAVWALLGIRFGSSETWQVIISDVQAILSYVFDSLLVRQQMNMYDREMAVAAQIQSRLKSHIRMLSKVSSTLTSEDKIHIVSLCEQEAPIDVQNNKLLPSEGKFGQFITTVSHVIGHLMLVGLFWTGVFIWIGIGSLFNWSDTWQLYMNSASSALMVLYFAFLANIRERHSAHAKRCLDILFDADSILELRLRDLTDDAENNPSVIIPAPKVGRLQRTIFYYADFVGTLVGIAILITVMIAWIATGPVFRFSSSWWLFIGTYAGLVGMNDGFVLRNMQSRLSSYVEKEMSIVEQKDEEIVQSLGLAAPFSTISERKLSATERVSLVVEKVSAHELTVAAGVLTIVGLLIGASAMKWSLTGQLLCNVPPSLIESFFMMILVTGHNLNDDKKRAELQRLYESRLRLLRYVHLVKTFRTHSIPTFEEKKAAVDTTFLSTVKRD